MNLDAERERVLACLHALKTLSDAMHSDNPSYSIYAISNGQADDWADQVDWIADGLMNVPAYIADLQSRLARAERDTLERAAHVCDAVNNYDNPMTANDCADAIRALGKGS